MAQVRSTRVVASLGVLLFWVGVLGAGARVDGYSAREDYISSLASRGSPVAVLGSCALLASAVAHLATSRAVLTGWRSRGCALFVLVAGVATAAVAAFRTSCPDGPAGCGLGNGPAGDWVDAAHGASVAAYEVCMVAAMLTLAFGALRATRAAPPWLGLISMAAAIGSVLLFGQTNGDDVGAWQRGWLANNLGWLLVVAWVAPRRHQAVD